MDFIMIPKKIHYCWFGKGEKPKLVAKCIASWKKYCPDYEIIEWNESNFDVELNPYTAGCYREGRYAFLSDYVRLHVVEKYGGIYLDTDVEVIRQLDSLLSYVAFFGFEKDEYVNSGLGFGAEKENPVVKKMIQEYDVLLDGKSGVIGCPRLNTKALETFGLIKDGSYQDLGSAVVFPVEYFNPYDAPTGRLRKTKNTYSIHWYAGLWMSRKSRIKSWIGRPFHRLLGKFFKRKNF